MVGHVAVAVVVSGELFAGQIAAGDGRAGDDRARNDTLTRKGIVMLNSPADIDAAIKRLKGKRFIDASLEADIRAAFREQDEEGTTVNELGHRRPAPRFGA